MMVDDASDKIVYTVGHSNRSFDYFLRLLQVHEIELVVDVRRFPTSKIEHFRGERLKKLLGEHEIGYMHIEGLGGFRKGGYSKYMEEERWKEAYRRLIALCERNICALMCKESNPKYCHRRYISEKMSSDGWEVWHILDIKRCVKHRELFPSFKDGQKKLDDYL